MPHQILELSEVMRSHLCEEIVQKKTGRFIFDNQWQSFRFSKTEIELETIEYTFPAKGNYKIAIKVIDVFGNDSTKILEYRVE